MSLRATFVRAFAALATLFVAGAMLTLDSTPVKAHALHGSAKHSQIQTVAAVGVQSGCHHNRHSVSHESREPVGHSTLPGGCHCIEHCLNETSDMVMRSRAEKPIVLASSRTELTVSIQPFVVPAWTTAPTAGRTAPVSRQLTGAVRVLVTNMRLRN